MNVFPWAEFHVYPVLPLIWQLVYFIVKTGADGGATSSDLDNLDAMSTASQCGSISSEQSLDPFAGESNAHWRSTGHF